MSHLLATPPLVDLLTSPPAEICAGGAGGEMVSPERAERLLEFAASEYERIAELDRQLGHVSIRHADRQAALAMRRLYDQWAEQAEGLIERVRAHGLRQRLAGACDKLDAAVGRTRAMLSVTLDSLERADEQVRKGECIPVEEVRRELRARSHG